MADEQMSHFVQRSHDEAEDIGRNPQKLRHRLRMAAGSLRESYRVLFPASLPVDAERKRIVSTCGRFALQWVNNGATPIGCVYVIDLKASLGS